MPSIIDGRHAFDSGIMGKIVNVVNTHINTTSTQSLTAQTTTQISGLSATITPTSTSSLIFILAQWSGEVGTTSPHDTMFGLQRGTTDLGLPTSPGNRNALIAPIAINYSANNSSTPECVNFVYLDSPATISEITYSVTINHYAAVTLYNQRTTIDTDVAYCERMTSSITLIELL